jgi:hypothetical protein
VTITERGRFNSILTGLAVAAAAALLSLQLLVPPIVGLANEGDFERIMGYAGFLYQTDKFDEKYYGHIVTEFQIGATSWYVSGYMSSETLLAYAARHVSLALFPGRLFDIRILGAIHMVLFLGAIGLFVRACRDLAPIGQLTAAFLLVLVLTDVGYAAAFNSFYPQAASLLFVLLTFGLAAVAVSRGGSGSIGLVLYFLCAGLFVCSKPQEFIHAPVLAALGVALARPAATGSPSNRGSRRRWGAALALAAALCVVALWYYRQVPKQGIRQVGMFHTVFHDLLQFSPDPQRDMKELDIDPSLARFIGLHAYVASRPLEDPQLQSLFLERFSYARLVAFYLRHPGRVLDRVRRAAPLAFRLRPKYLGNFAKSTGVAPRTKATRFALWSDLRAKLEPHALAALAAVLGGNLLAAGIAWRRASPRGRLFLTALAACLVTAGLEFGVCAFADALDDLGRHLFVFHALFDLILVADVAWVIEACARGRARRLASVPVPA